MEVFGNNSMTLKEHQRVSEILSYYEHLHLKDNDVSDLDVFAMESVLEQLIELQEDMITTFPFLKYPAPSSPMNSEHIPFSLQKKLWQCHLALAIDINTYTHFIQKSKKSILSEALAYYSTSELSKKETQLYPYEVIHQNNLETGPIFWSELVTLRHTLTDFSTGMVTCIAAKTLLAVGTSYGILHLFNSSQQLEYTLDSKGMLPPVQLDAVTCIAFSESEKLLLSGHMDGTLCLWDIPSKTMIVKIASKKSESPKCGHLKGSKITHLSFVGNSSVSFVSCDSLGIAFHHTCVSTYLGSIETKPLFGTHQNRLNRKHLTTILSMASILEAFVGILTPYKMVIMNTDPIQTIYRLLREDNVSIEHEDSFLVGSLYFTSPYLCMAWGTKLQVFEVGKTIDISCLRLVPVFAEETKFPIYSIRKLEKYIVSLDGAYRLNFYSINPFNCLEHVEIPTLVGHADFHSVSENVLKKKISNYFRSWACTNSHIYTLGPKSITQGELLSFKYRVLAMAKAGEVAHAINLSLEVYHRNSASYVYQCSKQIELTSFLCFMTLVCLRSPFLNAEMDIPQLIHFLLAISADTFLYSQFYEETRNCHYTSVFHDAILELLKSKYFQDLTPSFTIPFLNSLIEQEKWGEFETMLSRMTASMIDMDAAYRVCQKYQLHRGYLHLHRLSNNLDDALTKMLSISVTVPFDFLYELCTQHFLDRNEILPVLQWAQLHWVDVLTLPPSFILNYAKALFQWAPSNQRQQLADPLLDLLSLESYATHSVLIQIILVHAKKNDPDHIVLSSQNLHRFFIAWTTLTENENHLFLLDGFQQGLVYLLESLFFVENHAVFENVLRFSRQHQLWLVCEYLYIQLNQHVFLLDCLLFDPLRQQEVFQAIPSLLKACENQRTFFEHVLEVVNKLIQLDPIRFAIVLKQLDVGEWFAPIYEKLKKNGPFLILFLDTLAQFSPTLMHEEAFLHCFNLFAQEKNDIHCVSLIERHHRQFPCLDRYAEVCQLYELKVSLAKVYELQSKYEEALPLLLESGQVNRLLEFCLHYEPAWAKVISTYLQEQPCFLKLDMTSFLKHLPDQRHFVQSLKQVHWSSRLKKHLCYWTEFIYAKEIQYRLLTRLQRNEWLTWAQQCQTRTNGTHIISLKCLLCNSSSSVDVVWNPCGHAFHQRCLGIFFSSSKQREWTECVKCSQKLVSIFSESPQTDAHVEPGTHKVSHVRLNTDWFEVLTDLLSEAELGPFLESEL